MARIRQEDIEAVKERTDIVQLVGQYLTLKKSGHDSLTGLCPFHQEKTGSFSVSPSKQVFYCFGCGKGGDAITFLRELEHLSYVEAIERLAAQAGRRAPLRGRLGRRAPRGRSGAKPCTARTSRRQRCSRRCSPTGKEAADARAYVTERGISPESIETVRDRVRARATRTSCCGASPARATCPQRCSSRRGSRRGARTEPCATGSAGGSRSRSRICRVATSGSARASLPSDARASEQAKYLNTAETPIYRKHEVLYNMHRARQAIAKSGDVFVVEGYTDVIGLAQAGIANVVATCGTALGEQHFEQLSRFATRAILSFDSDEAGARAAERAFGFQETFPITAVVLIMPDGLDPADFVAKHGADAVRTAAASARPLVEYMVRRTVERHDLSTIEGQSAAVSAALPILERLSDPVRAVGVRGLARRPRRRVARVSVRAVARAPPRRQARGGRHDDEARHRP